MVEYRLAKNKTINIITAAILSFLLLGLGQIACGKIKRGISLYIISNILIGIAIFICIQPFNHNIFVAAIIYIVVFLFVIIDSIIIAKNPDNTLKLKPFVGYLLLVGILIVNSSVIKPVITKTIRNDFIQAFKIPAASMMPSILIGDHILVNKRLYRNSKPQKGDIVVFTIPQEPSKDFIRRIIGLSGDVIEIKNKQLYINSQKIEEDYIINTDSNILQNRDNYGPVTVPEGSLFVLGDNRDNSYDSRFWGFLDSEKLKGKVATIYWSWDADSSSVRWSRIGKLIK